MNHKISGQTKITTERLQDDAFFDELERWIAVQTGRDDGLNEWLGNSTADNRTAAYWAAEWMDVCAQADEA